MKKNYSYNDGQSICQIIDKNKIYTGTAVCHPEDQDFASQLTGLTIAEIRANITYLQNQKNNILIPQLEIVRHLAASLNYRCKRNPNEKIQKNPIAKLIWRQVHVLEKQLDTINQELTDERQYLKTYINGKEKIYKRIRDKRQ